MRWWVSVVHNVKSWGIFASVAVLAVLSACGPGAPAGVVLVPSLAPAATLTPFIVPSATFTVVPTLTASPTATLLPPTVTPSSTPTTTPSATLIPSPTTGPTPDAQAHLRFVELPILMYHYIEPWPPGPDEVRQGLTVTPEDFAAQMAYLHAHGYATVSLYDLVAALAVGQDLPEKAVVITFDDGYRTLIDFAVPIMQQYGYTGTVFVITQLMDEEFPQYLTWDQAKGLHAQGWMIEPHTKTHDQLAGRGRDFQLYQMLGSILTVEAQLGRTPRFFAYPSGEYDELTVSLVKELHLWGAATTSFGRVHGYSSLHTLTRVRVSGTGTLAEFVAALGEGP